MRNYLVLFVLLFLPWLKGVGQCPVGNIILGTQAAIDSFPMKYPNCISLDYNLTITGVITSLDSLYKIERCRNLEIDNTSQLKNLKGLSNLKELYYFDIKNNQDLTDISDFQPKTANSISISGNQKLLKIDCFERIELLSTLSISFNYKVETIVAQKGIVKYLYNLFISNNSSLLNIDSLNISRSVLKMTIINNPELKSIDFLKNVEAIGQEILIKNNPNLLEIDLSGVVKWWHPYSFVVENNLLLNEIRLPKTKIDNIVEIKILSNPKLQNIKNAPFTSANLIYFLWNDELKNLDCLAGLTSIEFMIVISENKNLSNIDSLFYLKKAHEIYIYKNELLNNSHGLDNLENISILDVSNNNNLNSIFSSNAVAKNKMNIFIVMNNPLLKDIQCINSISGLSMLQLENNNTLQTISFSNLQGSPFLRVYIRLNDSLKVVNIRNLDSIKSINIEENNKLRSIHLDTINNSSIISAVINSNSELRDIYMPRIAAFKTLEIVNNKNLEKIGDFSSLEILDSLIVEFDDNLKDLSGLQNLKQLKYIAISRNSSLTTLKYLKKLSKVDSQIEVSYNGQLNSIFHNLQNVNGRISISNNPLLTDISGLRNIRYLSNITLINNPLLTRCAIESICTSLAADSINYIYSNGVGCNSAKEVLDQCNYYSQIERVYPNPANKYLYFSDYNLLTIAKITIYDTNGRAVNYVETTSPQIDIGNLANGIYFFEVASEKLNFKQRFVKY